MARLDLLIFQSHLVGCFQTALPSEVSVICEAQRQREVEVHVVRVYSPSRLFSWLDNVVAQRSDAGMSRLGVFFSTEQTTKQNTKNCALLFSFMQLVSTKAGGHVVVTKGGHPHE